MDCKTGLLQSVVTALEVDSTPEMEEKLVQWIKAEIENCTETDYTKSCELRVASTFRIASDEDDEEGALDVGGGARGACHYIQERHRTEIEDSSLADPRSSEDTEKN